MLSDLESRRLTALDKLEPDGQTNGRTNIDQHFLSSCRSQKLEIRSRPRLEQDVTVTRLLLLSYVVVALSALSRFNTEKLFNCSFYENSGPLDPDRSHACQPRQLSLTHSIYLAILNVNILNPGESCREINHTKCNFWTSCYKILMTHGTREALRIVY